MGRKLVEGGLHPLFGEGESSPHLTQSRLGQGVPPYQVASLSMQPFGHNRHGPKIGGSAPFLGKGAGFPSNTMWHGQGLHHARFHLDPSNRLATIRQRHRQDRETDRQRYGSIGRTVLQTIARKLKPTGCLVQSPAWKFSRLYSTALGHNMGTNQLTSFCI